jgi:hypothetical protein
MHIIPRNKGSQRVGTSAAAMTWSWATGQKQGQVSRPVLCLELCCLDYCKKRTKQQRGLGRAGRLSASQMFRMTVACRSRQEGRHSSDDQQRLRLRLSAL